MPTSSSNNKKRNTRHKQAVMVVVLIVFLSSVVSIVRYSNLEATLRVGIAATSLENSTTAEHQQNLLFLSVGDNHSTTFVDIPYNPQRRIVHIHVGKCGGNSVHRVLYRVGCQQGLYRWKPKAMRQACLSLNQTALPPEMNESQVSLHTLHKVHIKGGGQNISIDYDTYLYTLRHPVDRVISAYSFLHYNNAKQSTFARGKHPVKDMFYKDCFPTLADLDRGLRPPPSTLFQQPTNINATSWSECQRLAVEILLDAAPDGVVGIKVNLHITLGFQYYYDRGGNHNVKDILVIRTEHLWSDMNQLDQALGGSGNFPDNVHSNAQKNKQHLDDVFHWCCLLHEENMVYQELILRAINLSNQQKQDSLRFLYQRCGIIHHLEETTTNTMQLLSWNDWWEEECPVWSNMPNQTWLTIERDNKKRMEKQERKRQKERDKNHPK